MSLVSLLTADKFGSRAGGLVHPARSLLLVSDFAAAEFASVVSRMVRTEEASKVIALGYLEAFDRWVLEAAIRIVTEAADLAGADMFLRRLNLPLRAPDAIHVAAARRMGADLATFDTRMAACARTLGLDVVPA